MSSRRSCVALALVLVLAASIPATASAQEESNPIVYASYFRCEPGSTGRAGEIIRDSWGPVVQSHIDSGGITAWGSLTHHTGGEWNRAVYMVGSDRAALFAELDEMGEEWNAADPDGVAEFWDACDQHEDYVWSYLTGSAPATELAQERPGYGMSVYWVCDEGREAVADLMTEKVFAEYWNAQVEAGLINSWSWMAHFLGGQYRRILVADGASHDALLTARDNVIEAMDESGALTAEFNDVCNGHTDYLWNIEVAAP